MAKTQKKKPNKRGGKRERAGRPSGTKSGERTEAIRLPISAVTELKMHAVEYQEIRQKIIKIGLAEDLAEIELDQLGNFWHWLKEELLNMKNEKSSANNIIYMERYRKYAEVAATPETIGVTERYHEEIEAGNYLIGNPQNTYILDVVGDSMIDEGIYNGTILIVEEYKSSHTDLIGGEMVVISLGTSLSMMVKIYHKDEKGKVYLISANSQYEPILVENEYTQLLIQGVVKRVVNPVTSMPLSKRNQYLQTTIRP